MITTILSDLCRVILLPDDDSYTGRLNDLNKDLINKYGDKYDFLKYFKFNEDLLKIYKDLKEKNEIYILTSDSIHNQPEVQKKLAPLISDIFSAKTHNLRKEDPAIYTFIVNKLKKIPQTFLYIDDLLENIEAAKKAGMEAIHFISVEKLRAELSTRSIL